MLRDACTGKFVYGAPWIFIQASWNIYFACLVTSNIARGLVRRLYQEASRKFKETSLRS